jgi:hypothetical protein
MRGIVSKNIVHHTPEPEEINGRIGFFARDTLWGKIAVFGVVKRAESGIEKDKSPVNVSDIRR